MLEGLPVAALGNGIGVVGVIVLMGWLVVTGRLVPKRFYDELVKALAAKDKQIAEKDVQLGHMSEVGKNFDAIMRALQDATKRDRGGPPS